MPSAAAGGPAPVEIDLLGGFRVRVDGTPLGESAWSRRDAAALVKLLALQPGLQLHREQVVDRLWPDVDPAEAGPRLHKAAHYARRALGRRDGVVLRGDLVALLPGVPVRLDVAAFEEAAESALSAGTAAAAGEVLDAHVAEPLLPEDLYAEWAAAARDRLALLVERLLRQARRWTRLVELDPLDESAQLALVDELAGAGDLRGALRQLEQAEQALRRELGSAPGPDLARLRERLVLDLRRAGDVTAAELGRLEQEIRFCRTADGVTLAYARSGTGPPLVKVANWLTHLEHDWHSPVWRHWLQALSRHHRLVRYDERGCGLSDRDIKPPIFEDWVRDLETVVDESGLDRFPLLGISQGAAVAVVYAARHPDRVTRLVLYGGYAQGRLARAASAEDRRLHALQVELVRLGWGRDEPTFRQFFSSQFMPDASRELWDAFNELQRRTASAEQAAATLELTGPVDVVRVAPQVRAPTLVLHALEDQRPPFSQGRLLASLIPDSRFVALESRNHILLADEPAWSVFVAEVEAFLAD